MGLSYKKHYPVYKFMIYKIIKQYSSHYNFDDMVQSAHLGFAQALKTYCKSKASLSTWVFINVRKNCQLQRNMQFQVKAHSETRKKLLPEVCSKIYDNTLIESRTPYDLYLENNKESEIAVIVALMSKRLTKMERLIFIDYYLNNKTITQLRKRYGIYDLDNLLTKFKVNLKEVSRVLLV